MRYRKLGRLGKGGMATVYLASTSGPGGFNKLLVLKELLPNLAEDSEFVKMFLDEARVCARLTHPNVVHTFDVVSEAPHHYMVMEYLEGQSLAKVIGRARWDVSRDLYLRAMSEVLGGLHAAHELTDYDGNLLQLVHRDVSPQNVFVCYDGRVKLLDFGVAKVRGALSETAQGVIKGKLAYMAPEVLMARRLDRRADIFSAGVMMWEMLARRRLTKGLSDVEVSGARVMGREPRLADVAPDTPKPLIAVCEKAMALNPADRYETAAAFKDALDELIEQSATTQALGKLVSKAFAEDRKAVARLVQDHLAEPPLSDRSVPSIRLESEASEPSGSDGATPGGAPLSQRDRKGPSWVLFGAVAAALAIGVGLTILVTRGSTSEPQPGAEPTQTAASIAPPASAGQAPATSQPEPSVTPSASAAVEPEATAKTKARPTRKAPVARPGPQPKPAKKEPATMGADLPPTKRRPPRSIDETDPYAK